QGTTRRRREAERVWDAQHAEARVLVPTRSPDVAGRPPHELEELRHVERRPLGPDPPRGSRDERRREARAVGAFVAARVQPERNRNRYPLSGRGQINCIPRAPNRRRFIALPRPSTPP